MISFAISPTRPDAEGDVSIHPIEALPSTGGEPTVIVPWTSSRMIGALEQCYCGDKIPYRSGNGVAMVEMKSRGS